MDQRYFEYHKIIASFVAGQPVEEPAKKLEVTVPSAESDRNSRMKSAFINAIREEIYT